jgi:PKD repeat protein
LALGTGLVLSACGGGGGGDGGSSAASSTPVAPPALAAAIKFTQATVAPVVGDTLQFAASADGGSGVYAYLWEFGDGRSATTANAVNSYAGAGTYAVKLTVTDSANRSAVSTTTVVVDCKRLGAGLKA